MAGRKRKAVDISTGKIGKLEKLKRKEGEEKLKLNRDDLKAPKWLSKEAKKEFDRIVSETEKIKILDNLDLGFIAMYCNSYIGYIEVTKAIKEMGIDKIGSKEFGSMVILQEKYSKQIMQCSSKLGLATTDRLKLVVPVKEEKKENKFLEILQRHG